MGGLASLLVMANLSDVNDHTLEQVFIFCVATEGVFMRRLWHLATFHDDACTKARSPSMVIFAAGWAAADFISFAVTRGHFTPVAISFSKFFGQPPCLPLAQSLGRRLFGSMLRWDLR